MSSFSPIMLKIYYLGKTSKENGKMNDIDHLSLRPTYSMDIVIYKVVTKALGLDTPYPTTEGYSKSRLSPKFCTKMYNR